MSPVALAVSAAGTARRAQVPASARLAYARRVAYRALRASFPGLPCLMAWGLAKTAARCAQTCA